MTKVMPTELLIREQVMDMTPEQFTAYETAIRNQPYENFSTNPDLVYALRAVNERRADEGRPMSITIRDGAGIQIPWLWVAGGVLAIALLARGLR